VSDRPRVLGIEGTAWAASAAVFDPDDGVCIETNAYQPESGGIDPSEAAEHMHNAIPEVVAAALDHAAALGDDDPPIDAVAFARGPGLGPCLRIVGTAARALSQALDVPLVGVNHMVAHLEIGRHRSGFDSPVCLNASGANAHVLGFHNGRYQVLGETMDTGVGNAIDKFTRHVGWSHPGGPKVEEAAADGKYTELPYVVKGMDFSFSGIMSAAKQEYDAGTPVEDVCRGLQETVFAMLTEVAERALSLTGSDELVLGGGVGQNDRLREMLAMMCEQRGAEFYAPESRFLRDNAGMIAVLGATMYEAGDTIEVADSRIDSDFRPDQVPVTWRSEESVAHCATETASGQSPREESVARSATEPASGQGPRAESAVEDGETRGAEATVTFDGDRVYKERVPKAYRHPDLDDRLRRERTTLEARLTSEARRNGVPTPLVQDVDRRRARITFERVGRADLQADLTAERVSTVGEHLAALHAAGIVHGDPTTRNVRFDDERVYLIDFGLGYYSDHVEDYAMDLHVFEQSLDGTAADPPAMCEAFEAGYAAAGEQRVLDQLREIEGRGRYQ
jgi:N6-L-threonylcarbamoyladenine synthase/protein kinase Bud32